MPLENDIQNLTAAINNLAAVFAGTAGQVGAARAAAQPAKGSTGSPEAMDELASSAMTKGPVKSKSEAKRVAAQTEGKTAAPAKAAPAKDDLDDTGEVIDFEEVKKVLRELGSVMTERTDPSQARQTTIDLLAEFKVAKAIELKPAQYAAFIARATALINGGDGAAEGEGDDLIG